MLRKLLIVSLTLLAPLLISASGILLQDIVNPGNIVVGNSNIYITQDTDVFIFKKNTGELIKKFGKQGEGPGEFRKSPAPWIPSLTIYLTPDNRLLINSMGKVSFFTASGEFISEHKVGGRLGRFMPLGKGYIKMTIERDGDTRVIAANLIDADFKKTSRLFSTLWPAQSGKKRNPVIMSQMTTLFDKYTCGKGVALPDEKGNFHIFNTEGKKILNFTPPYTRIKPDKAFQNSLDKFFSEDPRYKRPYTQDKNRGLIELPSRLPEYRDYRIDENNVYVISNFRKDGKYEMLVYSLNGKMLKKTFIPLAEKDLLNVFPFDIRDGKLFQVVTDDDEEECKLVVNKI